jgi:hypothetical protein
MMRFKSILATGACLVLPLSAGAVSGVPRTPNRSGPSPTVVDLGFSAISCAAAAGALDKPKTLTIIDYSRASSVPRLWVLDAATREILFEELVAHGSGSGDNFAMRFSNKPDSHQSSLGLFVTEKTYAGKHGYSLRLNGLEPTNDRALERAIVIHGASYVSAESVAALGRLGRSWGCPALRPDITRQVIDRIKGGDAVFAYYPDKTWLASSPFLGKCLMSSSSTLQN